MTDWAAIYAPLIGLEIKTLKWRPLPSDTPSLVDDFSKSSFCFTGGIEIVFARDHSLFQTWRMVSGSCHLVAAIDKMPDWDAHALDSIKASWEKPWGSVVGATLTEGRFYTLQEDFGTLDGYRLDTAAHLYGHPVAAVRHAIRAPDGNHFFWLAIGNETGVWDQDDLWVAADTAPPNLDALVEIGRVGD